MPSRERSSYFLNIIKESFQSISRNTLIAVAAIVSIIAALLILGVFIIFTINVNQLTDVAESNSEIKVFLREGVSQEQKDNLYQILISDERVSQIDYESKEQALENFSKRLNDYSFLLSEYTEEDNPLPESFIVKTYNIEDLKEIRDLANEYPDVVEYVRYQESFVDSLTSFSNFVNIVALGLLLIMSIVALYLIYNTIRLTVANRQKEIEIMKAIGATDSYIEWPFILEGTFIGLMSALFSILLISVVYYYLIGYLNGSLLFALGNVDLNPANILILLLFSFIIYGVVIGSAGALYATHKYLDV